MNEQSPRSRHGTATLPASKAPSLRHLDPVFLNAPESHALPHRSMMNWPRKIFHMIGIGSVGLTLAFASVTQIQALWILGAATALIVTLDLIRRWIPSLNDKVYTDFRFIMRDYERKNLTGMSWFLLGMMLVLLMAPRQVAGLAALLLAFGDPWASYFGIRFGRRRLFGSKKTLEGLLGGFAVCALVSTCYLAFAGLVSATLIVPAAILAGLAGAIAEALPAGKIDDNFLVPVVSTPALLAIIALLN